MVVLFLMLETFAILIKGGWLSCMMGNATWFSPLLGSRAPSKIRAALVFSFVTENTLHRGDPPNGETPSVFSLSESGITGYFLPGALVF